MEISRLLSITIVCLCKTCFKGLLRAVKKIKMNLSPLHWIFIRQYIFFLVPSFLTTFFGLYFSHHYTQFTHYKSCWTFCVATSPVSVCHKWTAMDYHDLSSALQLMVFSHKYTQTIWCILWSVTGPKSNASIKLSPLPGSELGVPAPEPDDIPMCHRDSIIRQ